MSDIWGLENLTLKFICWVLTPKSMLLVLNGVTQLKLFSVWMFDEEIFLEPHF